MKVLMITCGVGIGHASRDLALAEYLKEYDYEVEFASYGSGLHYYEKNNLNPHQLPSMNFEGTDGAIDIDESLKQSKDIPFTFIKSMYKDATLIRQIKPDLVIADSDYSTPIASKFLNIPCIIITNDLTFGFSELTDNSAIQYFEKSVSKIISTISKGCQSILIPDIPETVEIPKELENKSTYIGPLLHKDIQKEEPVEITRQRHGFTTHEKIIVVTIGGSEFGKLLITIVIEMSSQINADKIIIFTGLEIDPEDFNIDPEDKKVIIKQFSYNLTEWMKLSNLTIALAGHTTSMELLTIKKPNILIPLENHIEQNRNIKRMMDYNITKTTSIKNKEELLHLINESLEHIDDIKINQEMYDEFIQYEGCARALEIIENINNNK
ncbi:MAG: hypothetical protein LUG89_01690 [Methanosphaera sp.]|nr:hypothetical protein [Methanosphaera sp.]